MFHLKYFCYFILLHLVNSTPQINLYYTNENSENVNIIQHNCLYIVDHPLYDLVDQYRSYYCMSESPPKLDVEAESPFPTFTFAQLSQRNITSDDLYLWSASVDLIEDYQFYLNQLTTTSKNLSLSTNVFYNCTWPRFGTYCRYAFRDMYKHYTSLRDVVTVFMSTYAYSMAHLTCYKDLKCDHIANLVCLDWSEICDGKIDCPDTGADEEHCWELEINECGDNEYRCRNGQCIPKSFTEIFINIPYCMDGSDIRTLHKKQFFSIVLHFRH